MTQNTKTCVTCKHHSIKPKHGWSGKKEPTNVCSVHMDAVTGERLEYKCYFMRSHGACGIHGELWEAK